MEKTYNGWRNYETWNVSLWINNEESLYRWAVKYVRCHPRMKHLYRGFVRSMGIGRGKTADGVKWVSDLLDYDALDQMMAEILD